jgi:hypothetical protein
MIDTVFGYGIREAATIAYVKHLGSSRSARGSMIRQRYVADTRNVEPGMIHKGNRTGPDRTVGRHLLLLGYL